MSIKSVAESASFRVAGDIFATAVALALLLIGSSAAQERQAAPADAGQPATIPPVLLSKQHEALCSVKVSDTMPAIELEQLGEGRKSLAELAGSTATVVVFWKSDRRMALEELADLGPDVLEPYGRAGVSVVGIAVGESADGAQAALQKAGANFPTLLDAEGSAFAQVGSERLPRTYLIDPQGKILWFDIEYSLATRRELQQALRALTTQPR
jgi:peroxiredoxin